MDDEAAVLSGLLDPTSNTALIVAGLTGTKHLADAVDYEDEDLMAEDELPEEEPALGPANDNDDFLADLAAEGEVHSDGFTPGPVSGPGMEELRAETERRAKRQTEVLLRFFYPTFKRGVPIRMLTYFGPKPELYLFYTPRVPLKPMLPHRVTLEPEADTRRWFRGTQHFIDKQVQLQNLSKLLLPPPSVVHIDDTVEEETEEQQETHVEEDGLEASVRNSVVFSANDWNDAAIIDPSASHQPSRSKIDLDSPLLWTNDDEAIFSGRLDVDALGLKLDLNDPRLLFDVQPHTDTAPARVPVTEKQLLRRFNVSNDSLYAPLKKNYHKKVRSGVGQLVVEHSAPAVRLQTPYYKVSLDKRATRNFHRPKFVVRPGTIMLFAKPKVRKRKRDKGKEVKELFAKLADLTMGDLATVFTIEYSEEFPVLLLQFGMGTKLVNYYRKVAPEDPLRPKLAVGETHVLAPTDPLPFWNFGVVEPGNVVPTLYNHLVRAPVFQHQARTRDFLLVRLQGCGVGQRYFFRKMPHVLVAGQTLPAVEVPAPHLRKALNISKNRLRMIVYRVLNQLPHARLSVKDILAHFPEQTDMQSRQRLKEFMEYQRQGPDQGFWKIRNMDPNAVLPSEDEIKQLLPPEDVVLLANMQAGMQRLKDAGYFSKGMVPQEDEYERERNAGDEELVEEQLAVWNTTRNFVNATQGKAMLQLHGEGDPLRIGVAFLFLKTSMKGGFRLLMEGQASTPGTPAEGGPKQKREKQPTGGLQQKVYDEEIARTWYAQQKSLGITTDAELAEQYRDFPLDDSEEEIVELERPVEQAPVEAEAQQTLRITRRVRDANGIIQRVVETVTDARVIAAYIKKRREMEEDRLANTAFEDLKPTDDARTNEKHRKRLLEEIERLEKAKEKAAKRPKKPENPNKGIGKGKNTARRCATCGAIGHIRTNKLCPMYGQPPRGELGAGGLGAAAQWQFPEQLSQQQQQQWQQQLQQWQQMGGG